MSNDVGDRDELLLTLLARLEVLLDHVLDVAVARSAVAARAARERHVLARSRAGFDGFADLHIGDGVADADEHFLRLTIVIIAFTFKRSAITMNLL